MQTNHLALVPGVSLIANQLINLPGAASTNTVSQISGELPDGLLLAKINTNGSFVINQYLTAGGWSDPAMTLMPGEGCFAHNPAATNVAIDFVGVAPVGTITNFIPAGFSLCSSILPQAGLITTDLGFPVSNGDRIYCMKPEQAYTVYTYFFSRWLPGEPAIAAGESFWAKKLAPVQWIRNAPTEGQPDNYPGWTSQQAVGDTNSLYYLNFLAPDFKTLSLQVSRGADITLTSGTTESVQTIYQWQQNGTNLSDGVGLLGAQTATLKLSSVQRNRAGNYLVAVSNATASGSHTVATVRVVSVASTPPAFGETVVPGAEGFIQDLTVELDKDYRIQVSTNLVNWMDLTNFLSAGTVFQITDPRATNVARRFFRAVSP